LGPSTIVGSAAFNLLIISGVSIIAVGTKDDPAIKKVYDTGVFAITSIASLFAYIWMYLTLKELGDIDETIEMWEAWLTLAFFFILIGMAFAADKLNNWHQEKKKTIKDKEE
jgi:solute carrier family 8 (sodium/calcium exchanger)